MTSRFVAVLAVASIVAGCAFIPTRNHRLEETRALYRAAQHDPALAQFAPAEMSAAAEAMQRAQAAWTTRDDVAVVDHLAYLARQRIAIARAAARRAIAQRDALDPRLEHGTPRTGQP